MRPLASNCWPCCAGSRRSAGIPVVASTHDVEAAVRMGQDGWLIGPGGRCTSGTVDVLASSGAIGAAFDTSAVTFESASGMFRMR